MKASNNNLTNPSGYTYNDGRIDGLIDLLEFYPDKETLTRTDIHNYIEYLEERFAEED